MRQASHGNGPTIAWFKDPREISCRCWKRLSGSSRLSASPGDGNGWLNFYCFRQRRNGTLKSNLTDVITDRLSFAVNGRSAANCRSPKETASVS